MLQHQFAEAVRVTKDFEPIFSTGFYDEAPLPDSIDALEEISAFIEDTETYPHRHELGDERWLIQQVK
jgi:uncharacterized protein YozE (UPF0346 family)